MCLSSVLSLKKAEAEEMEGFTKEVLMMWREALDEEEGRCTALKAGRRGTLGWLPQAYCLNLGLCSLCKSEMYKRLEKCSVVYHGMTVISKEQAFWFLSLILKP